MSTKVDSRLESLTGYPFSCEPVFGCQKGCLLSSLSPGSLVSLTCLPGLPQRPRDRGLCDTFSILVRTRVPPAPTPHPTPPCLHCFPTFVRVFLKTSVTSAISSCYESTGRSSFPQSTLCLGTLSGVPIASSLVIVCCPSDSYVSTGHLRQDLQLLCLVRVS